MKPKEIPADRRFIDWLIIIPIIIIIIYLLYCEWNTTDNRFSLRMCAEWISSANWLFYSYVNVDHASSNYNELNQSVLFTVLMAYYV